MSQIQTLTPDLVGSAPALAQLSDFQYGEAGASYASNPGSVTGARPDVIKLQTIRQLTKRKIYLWLWADLSATFLTTPFQVSASLKVLLNNSVVASLPVNIGISSTSFSGATPYTQSLVTVCTAGGNVTGDSLGLYIANSRARTPALMRGQSANADCRRAPARLLRFTKVTLGVPFAVSARDSDVAGCWTVAGLSNGSGWRMI